MRKIRESTRTLTAMRLDADKTQNKQINLGQTLPFGRVCDLIKVWVFITIF